MVARDIVVIGASAGGLAPLQTLVRDLPVNLAASLFVVMHIPATSPSILPHLLEREGPLPAVHATDGAAIEPGHIYVAPPDRHLVVEPTRMRLLAGPRENGSRPAIDPLFRSAAESFGARVIGIILSGTRADGSAGLETVARHGGATVVQSAEDAAYPGMPQAAIDAASPDYVATASEIPRLVRRLVGGERVDPGADPRAADPSGQPKPLLNPDPAVLDRETALGTPSGFSCPECGGTLWAMPGIVPRFRCRTGHDFSGDALLDAQSHDFESVLWAGLRGAQEAADLAHRLESAAEERGHHHSAHYFAERRLLANEKINLIRAALGSVLERASPGTVPHRVPDKG